MRIFYKVVLDWIPAFAGMTEETVRIIDRVAEKQKG